MTPRLLPLRCPNCQASLDGTATERLFFCRGCQGGVELGATNLERVAAVAIRPEAPSKGWEPAWEVVLERRILRRKQETFQTTHRERLRWIVPARELPARDLLRSATEWSGRPVVEQPLPAEPVGGGVLLRAELLPYLRYLVLSTAKDLGELGRDLEVEITPLEHRLLALPLR